MRQCQLTGISRSGPYYRAVEGSAENLELMHLLDEQYTRTPFYGVRRMASWLGKQGYTGGDLPQTAAVGARAEDAGLSLCQNLVGKRPSPSAPSL